MTAPREMESSTQALTGKVAMTAPHYKATEVGLAVLQVFERQPQTGQHTFTG